MEQEPVEMKPTIIKKVEMKESQAVVVTRVLQAVIQNQTTIKVVAVLGIPVFQ